MDEASFEPIEGLLQALWDHKGTDLLLTAGSAPWLRVDGDLIPLQGVERLTPADTEDLILGVLTSAQAETLDQQRQVDFSFNWHDRARFRGNAFTQRGSLCLSLRLIPYAVPSIDDLGLPESVRRLASLPQGLVLVTGPTGSGKSTTLASLIDHVNRTRAAHIITIEDPIEYVHRHNRSAVNQRQIGEDAATFPSALRAALREDPDVVLIGEMRDLETIQTALTIAETGHLVFATLHTNDTAQSVDRIVDVFPSGRQQQIRVQLANTLAGIVYQQLLPRRDGGRVAAHEVLIATYAIRNLIKEGKTRQIRTLVATGHTDGMQTLEMALSRLVSDGVVERDQAQARSLYPNEIIA